jgi:hypothetical protein
MGEWKLVYDFGSRFPIPDFFFFIPLILTLVGLIVYYHNKSAVSTKETITFEINKRKYIMVFGLIFATVCGLFFIITVTSFFQEFFLTSKIYRNKEYQIVEGKVGNYHPMPHGGHDSERFQVNNIHFKYSDYDLSNFGYNNAASHGGVIRENLLVRIAYFHNGDKNIILKLETKY